MNQASFFRYRTGTTFLHRLPGWVKIIVMLLLAVGAFYLPAKTGACLWFCVLLFTLLLRFSPRDILSDLRPAFLYSFLLYMASLSQHLLAWSRALQDGELYSVASIVIPESAHVAFAVQLGLSLSITSLFYRTTSNVQFHEGFAAIECALTRQPTPRYADRLSLTLTFIPRIVANWQQLDKAWIARGGKNGVRKILALVPQLFSVSLKYAYDKALAIENRRLNRQ